MARTHGIAVLVLAGVAAWAGVQPAAGAADANRGTYSVTIVARQCPSFDSIMANRVLPDDRRESLHALGKKSVYVEGEPVSPAIEESNNPGCTPLDDWRFQFGDSDSGRRVNGLSTVGDPGRVTPPTTTVPLLDDQGSPTDLSIAGAVTVELDADELAVAQRGHLFIQGGTADDPLLYSSAVNADRLHRFGALRCAVDQVHGDNLERISYPPGVRHVFCYYFTVAPLPGDGTIVVRKEVTGRDTATFRFRGSVSFAPRGRFDLTVERGRPAEMRFRRAAGETWNFTELPDPDYQPAGPPSCVSENGHNTFHITAQRVGVVLTAGDRVLCTYRNERRPSDGDSAPSLGILLPIVAAAVLLIGLGIMLLLLRRKRSE